MRVYKSQGGFYKAFDESFSGCKRLYMYVCPLEHLSDKMPQKLARGSFYNYVKIDFVFF